MDAAVPPVDAPFEDPFLDTDGDRLCDATERSLALDPGDVDTDGDGFPDGIEWSWNTDPRMADSPARAQVLYLDDEPGARLDFPITFSIRGDGASYAGAFLALPTLFDAGPPPDGGVVDAYTFWAGARATGATPREHVTAIEDERFRVVLGRTLLVFTGSLEQRTLPAGCARALPFQYQLKDETNGRIAGARRLLLVTTAGGALPRLDGWCLPARCR